MAQERGMERDGSYVTPAGEVLRSAKEKATYLRTVQDWIVAPQLKNTPGLAGVDVIGGYVKQYVVTPDPQRLAVIGIGLSELAEALERNNTSAGAGVLVQNGGSTDHPGKRPYDKQRRRTGRTVIATRGGTPVLLSQVARVSVGQELRFGSASEGGVEVVVGTAVMRIGENSRTVAAAVDARLKEIARSLPSGLIIKPVLNRTRRSALDSSHGCQKPDGRRLAGHRCAVCAAGKSTRRADRRRRDSNHDAAHVSRHVKNRLVRQPDEPGRPVSV
jgi:cobalt-zinc-cadmium resistance protein CzcA